MIRRDPLVIFYLIIGVILPAILSLIVENVILKYIFMVFALSFFSILFFYDVFKIIEKNDIVIYLSLMLFCGLVIPWYFSLIHELSHAITAIINGIEISGIEMNYPMGGVTHLEKETNFIGRENVAILIFISGSLGSSLTAFILNRIAYKKITFSVFFPLFIITSLRIVFELLGWIIGVNYFIEGLSDNGFDPVGFLYYSQIDPVFLLILLIVSLIVILGWFIFNLIKRIREERNTIKKSIKK
ncbi:hypothetical protein LCGC14_0524550 [marine sediment metagenome]|uniref:Peptidase M50 domain-containing protein n=1 Tax=marine sediment metagenome TaxID=412755 RepID=A0A0F9RXI9_9ZZZZ